MTKSIAPGVTNQVPPQPPMWRGPQATVSGSPPENWAMGPSPSANELIDPSDLIMPMGATSIERLGAAYHIKANIPYDQSQYFQPTRASEFYGWTTGR